jgi:integrase
LTLLGLRREEVGGLRWSDIELDTGALHIRRARVDVNGRDTIVPTKTERSARGLPVPPRELAMLKAMRSVHLRERLAVGRPLTDADLLLSRVDGTWLPVREYSREFAAQRTAAGLEAITLGKLRHSNISRMRAAGIAADVVAAWHGHTERMTQAVYGRVADDRRDRSRGRLLLSGRTDLGHKASCGSIRLTSKTRSDTGQNGFSTWS